MMFTGLRSKWATVGARTGFEQLVTNVNFVEIIL
jgi:hypothetical protein